MFQVIRALLFFAFVVIVFGGGAYVFLLRSEFPEEPELSGSFEENSVQHQDYWRTYSVYVPERVQDNPPVLIALHGSRSTGRELRMQTSYEFDSLADEHGFLVVYPDGFGSYWNDCRAQATHDANRLGVDDLGFLEKIVTRLEAHHGANRAEVFAFGFSDGGHLGYRVALEAPDMVRGVAVVAANLPTHESLNCRLSGEPVSILVLNGMRDPISPYFGGHSGFFGSNLLGLLSTGPVLSTEDTVAYFVGLLEKRGALVQNHRVRETEEKTIFRRAMALDAKNSVLLVQVADGGHTIPHPTSTFPKILGETANTFKGPQLIWEFFRSLTDNNANSQEANIGYTE